MNIKKFTNSYLVIFILIAIFGLSVFLRAYNLTDNIFFGYDQARDFQRIFQLISTHNLKLLGPETYIPGLFNSPFYYYLLTPIYILFNGDPNIAVFFLIFINASVIFLLYRLSVDLFNNRWIGIIAAFLWSISFEQINFARHLSQAPLAIAFTTIFYLGLTSYFIKNKASGLTISLIGLALSIHTNIYFIYLACLYPLFYFIYKPHLKLRIALLNSVLFCSLLATFILSELKFKFIGIKALLAFMDSRQGASSYVMDNLSGYIQRITEAFVYSFFSFNYFWAFLLIIAIGIYVYKTENKKNVIFLLVLTLTTLPLFSYKSSILETAMINTSIIAPLTLLVAVGIYDLLKDRSLRIVGIASILLIIISNARLLMKDEFMGMKRIAYQNLTLKDEKALVNYTYNAAKKSDFSVCAVTNPLFVNTLWSYLFFSYGQNSYGYVPTWAGQRQDYIESLLYDDVNHATTRYLIIEPMIGIPDIAKKATIYYEDQVSVLEEERKFGDITVQKRRLEENTSLLKDTQGLTTDEINSIKATQLTDPRYSCYLTY